MSVRMAQIISVVLHPLLMPTLIFLVLFFKVPLAIKPFPESATWTMLGFIFFMTYIIPLVSVALLRLNSIGAFFRYLNLRYSQGLPSSEVIDVMESEENGSHNNTGLLMKNRKERITPFAFITIWYAMSTYFFIAQGQFNFIFPIILGSITLVILLVTAITFFWKISIHSAGAMGMFGILMAINIRYPGNNLLIPILVAVIICGLVMSSRLQLNEHDSQQVYSGALIGFVVCFSGIYFLL